MGTCAFTGLDTASVYRVDTALMAEMRAVMRQAAEEMRQWVAGCFGQKPRTPRFFFTDASLLPALLQY